MRYQCEVKLLSASRPSAPLAVTRADHLLRVCLSRDDAVFVDWGKAMSVAV